MKNKDNKIVNDNLIPFDLQVEEAVLGAVLMEGIYIDKIIGLFSPDLFYSKPNFLIAESVLELYRESKPIDLITISQSLKRRDKLLEVGGPAFIANLTSKVASTANLEFHLYVLQEHALKRKVMKVCSNALNKAADNTEDIFDVFQQLSLELESSLKDIMHYEVAKVAEIHQRINKKSKEINESGQKSGVPCGLTMVDNLTNGWQNSDLIILAGRPSMGKTAAAVSMLMHPALKLNIPIAIFSLEMSDEQLVSRMQSSLSFVNVSRIVKKQLSKDDIASIERNCKQLDTAPVFIDDTPNISLLEIKSKARKLVREHGVKMIVIDYLQLMRSGRNIQNREQEIAEISRGLKGLAKELDIPIMALSQLSRLVESRADKKPMLSDLRESGQIEQDADMVMFCYRPEYYDISSYEIGSESFASSGLFMLIIAKHRNGELGEIPLQFIHEQTKLTNHNFSFVKDKGISSTFVQDNQIGYLDDKQPF